MIGVIDMKKYDTVVYKIIRPVVAGLVKVFFRPQVVGLENIPKEGPYVLASNHTKWLDPVLLVGVAGKKQVHFLAKEEMWHDLGWIVVKAMGCIPVNRKIHDKDALLSAYEFLNNGSCIGIFPEGTINKTDELVMPFKIGAVKMCSETGAKLVPVVITGKYKWFRKGIKIEFLKPREVKKDLELENERLMTDISEKLGEYFLVTKEKKVPNKGVKKRGKR